jgi:hypothetical protein
MFQAFLLKLGNMYCWFISTLGHISYVVLFVGLLLSLDPYKGDDGEKMTSEKNKHKTT